MTNVNPVDGIVYGFRIIGYIIAVFLAGGLVALIGAEIDGVVGGLIALVGTLAVFAGFLGIQFKLIADGVERGIRASQGTAPEGEGLSGLPFIGNSNGRQQRQQRGQQQRRRQNQGQRGQQQRGRQDRQRGEQGRQRQGEQGRDQTGG